jgi:hypothetical protein
MFLRVFQTEEDFKRERERDLLRLSGKKSGSLYFERERERVRERESERDIL